MYTIVSFIRRTAAIPFAFTLGVATLGCGSDSPAENGGASSISDPGNQSSTLRVELLPLEEGTGTIRYALTNVSNEVQRFLPTDTAVKSILHDLFEVRLGAAPVEYVGPSVYFSLPSKQDFVELAPGESLSSDVRLTELYAMDQVGAYSVRGRSEGPAMLSEDASEIRRVPLVEAPAVSITVDEAHLYQPTPSPVVGSPVVEKAVQQGCLDSCLNGCTFLDPAAIGPCQVGCPDICNQRPSCDVVGDNLLNAANSEAARLLGIAVGAINPPSTSPLRQVYLDYFGIRTNERVAEVTRVLTGAQRDILGPRQFCLAAGSEVFPGDPTSACSPLGTTGAFIYAGTNGSRGQNVAYCPQFFALASARDRAGIVVHEASHHFGIQDIRNLTDSLVNDRLAAQCLITANPGCTTAPDVDAALLNAPNYQFYVTDSRF